MSQIPLSFQQQASLAENDYIVSAGNETLFTSLMHPERWNSHGCLLIGEPGSGKTHLAHIWCSRFGAAMLAPEAIAPSDAGFILIDNIEQAGPNPEGLFHLLNSVRETNRKILLTASSVPAGFITLPDVLSRLKALFTLTIPGPDEEMMRGIIHKLFADRQLRVEEGVIDYILTRTERSYRALQSLIATLDESSLIRKQGVTIPLARQVLGASGG